MQICHCQSCSHNNIKIPYSTKPFLHYALICMILVRRNLAGFLMCQEHNTEDNPNICSFSLLVTLQVLSECSNRKWHYKMSSVAYQFFLTFTSGKGKIRSFPFSSARWDKLPRAQLPGADLHQCISKAKHCRPRHLWQALLLWGGGRADREGQGASSTISVSYWLWLTHRYQRGQCQAAARAGKGGKSFHPPQHWHTRDSWSWYFTLFSTSLFCNKRMQ